MNEEKDNNCYKCNNFQKLIDENLKPEINQFLFKWLPDNTTLIEMDKLGIKIFDLIEEFHREKQI